MALAEFDPLRRRLQSQFTKQRQLSGDALQRRFASQGMLSSGAYAKTAAKQDAELAEKEAEALSAVDFQEAMEARRRQELEEGRKYQTSEREASQGFARGERLGSQEFNKGLFDTEQAFKEKAYANENQWREREFEQDRINNYLTQLVNADADFDDPVELNALLERLRGLGVSPPPGAVAPKLPEHHDLIQRMRDF